MPGSPDREILQRAWATTPHGWADPLFGLMVGLSFAFPLFLIMRERQLRARRQGAVAIGMRGSR